MLSQLSLQTSRRHTKATLMLFGSEVAAASSACNTRTLFLPYDFIFSLRKVEQKKKRQDKKTLKFSFFRCMQR